MPHDNPLGLDGFEFVEFTGPDPEALAGLFTAMGFTHLGNHKSKNVRHYGQGDINFILNMDPAGQAADFRQAHGPSANGMAFRVKDAKQAFATGSSTYRRSRASAAPTFISSTAMARRRFTTSTSSRSRGRSGMPARSASTRSTTSPTM
jgi:4-hydroxyphenylpyruvate dioxygenase-like putative hemolysin